MTSSLEPQEIFKKIIEVVRLCQTKYSNKKELATDTDTLVLKLCNLWEDVLNCGLRSNKLISDFTDLFKNVQDIVSGNSTTSFSFWDFCKNHLSSHERERFENLKNVTTKDGRLRALIRNSLNEHSLERYICMWLGDPTLKEIYDPTALMIDAEATNLLPNLASGLNTILFAITVDCPTINLSQIKIIEEPIIYVPTPVGLSKKAPAIERDILSFEEEGSDSLNYTYQVNTTEKEPFNFEHSSVINDVKNISVNYDDDINVLTENKNNPTVKLQKENKTDEIKEYLHSLGGKIFYENDLSDKEYLESESSSSLSKSASYSGMNLSNSYTSSLVSESHLNDTEKIKFLEEQLKTMTERCKFLESRVAELSLENHRLLKLKNYIDNDFGNFNVTIPKVNLIKEKNSKHYIYEIHITSREQESWVITKRYSDFYKLYQDMLKKHSSLVKTIDFPPKKLGNMNASFVEERRQRLQMYLRSLLKILPQVLFCTSKEELEAILPFFK